MKQIIIISYLLIIPVSVFANEPTKSNSNDIYWIIQAIIGLIAAGAWIPFFFNIFKKAKIKLKPIFYLNNKVQVKGEWQVVNFIELSIISLNKNYNLNKVEVNIKYKNEKTLYNGDIFCANNIKFKLDHYYADGNKKQEDKIFDIPRNLYLQYMYVFPKDKPITCFLLFKIDKANIIDFEYIEIVFYDFKNRKKINYIKFSDIDKDSNTAPKEFFKEEDVRIAMH